MTNLEAKQEAIKNAYCNNFDKVKDYVDENGWIFWSDKNPIGIYNNRYLEYKEENPSYWRPKSLQGIENNNGWIRIDDFVKYTNEKFWIFNSYINDLYQGQLFDDDMFPINRYATHYQPIEKPKPPIY